MMNPKILTLVEAHGEFAKILYGEPALTMFPLTGSPAEPDIEAVTRHWERELRARYGPLVAVGGGVLWWGLRAGGVGSGLRALAPSGGTPSVASPMPTSAMTGLTTTTTPTPSGFDFS